MKYIDLFRVYTTEKAFKNFMNGLEFDFWINTEFNACFDEEFINRLGKSCEQMSYNAMCKKKTDRYIKNLFKD